MKNGSQPGAVAATPVNPEKDSVHMNVEDALDPVIRDMRTTGAPHPKGPVQQPRYDQRMACNLDRF